MTTDLHDLVIAKQPRTCIDARDITCGLRVLVEEP
jgi:hypothetical protein